MSNRSKTQLAPRPAPRGNHALPERSIIWQERKVKTCTTAEQLQAAIDDPTALVWLDITGDPTPYMALLIQMFKLTHLTRDTILELKERAKLNQGNNYFYLIVHSLVYTVDTQEVDTPKLDIVFGPNYILTLHREEMPWLDMLWQTASRREPEEHVLSQGVALLLHKILDMLVDSYFPILDQLDDQIDDLENLTVNSANDAVQAQIFRMKRSLSQMRRVISPQVEVANALVTRTGSLIPQEIEPYFAEVHDHLIRVFEVLDSYRDLMSGLLDVYLTTVSNRLNDVMKQLAIISTIFLPITFVTGVFGQNFGHIPQVEHDNGYAFYYVLAGMVLITIAQLWFFKRRGWIG